MASFVYFYSKFTDEFLLLTASAMFFLLASYCYHWAVNRRRLGSSPQMVPASVVKEYLNQLINEAQFIRTQLFGILSSANSDPEHVDALFNNLLSGRGSSANYAGVADASESSDAHLTSGTVPPELMDRIKSLESQLAEKEGMIVNVNVEKTKLLKDLETFKASGKSPGAAGGSDKNNDELLKRLKMLEQQLEEYNMFEDDLANIKRIQQENEQLKRKIEEVSAYNGAAVAKAPVAAAPAAPLPEVKGETALKAPSLDQASIDALLEGESPVPPVVEVAPPTAVEMPVAEMPAAEMPSSDLDALAKSVESSLEASLDVEAPAPTPAPVAAAPKLAAVAAPAPAPAAEAMSASAKSDEELLKEFENLLNSG